MRLPEEGRGCFVVLGVVALGGVVLFAAPWWPGCRRPGAEGALLVWGLMLLLGSAIVAIRLPRLLRGGASHARLAATTGAVAVAMYLTGGFLIGGLLGAIDRGTQKRTMGDMREIANGLESYFVQHYRYPLVARGAPLDDLAAQLVPTHVKQLPVMDGWGFPYIVESSALTYTIASHGCCGQPDGPEVRVAANGGTTDYRDDIVFSDGRFVRFPDGTQGTN